MVVLYVTKSSLKCRMLAEILESRNVRYRTRDIVAEPGAMLELAELTGGRITVPSVAAGRNVLVDPGWKQISAWLRSSSALGIRTGRG